jgi:hypothetical protein
MRPRETLDELCRRYGFQVLIQSHDGGFNVWVTTPSGQRVTFREYWGSPALEDAIAYVRSEAALIAEREDPDHPYEGGPYVKGECE